MWLGRDFQEYSLVLVERRYAYTNPHSFQRVPDRHQGDLGIEAFSLDGCVYQCYAAEEPLSVEQCYEKQRDKLTADLGKLASNATDLHAMLGTTVITKYVYLVHRHDSRKLVAHATAKAAEVIEWGLPFISPDFRIVVETVDNYAAERLEVDAVPRPVVVLEDLQDGAVGEWQSANASLIETVDRKLSVFIIGEAERANVTESLLAGHLAAENALERLRTISAEAYHAVVRARAQRERVLSIQFPPASNNQATLPVVASELADLIQEVAQIVPRDLAESLAWSSVMDWLMRCPLEFSR